MKIWNYRKNRTWESTGENTLDLRVTWIYNETKELFVFSPFAVKNSIQMLHLQKRKKKGCKKNFPQEMRVNNIALIGA